MYWRCHADGTFTIWKLKPKYCPFFQGHARSFTGHLRSLSTSFLWNISSLFIPNNVPLQFPSLKEITLKVHYCKVEALVLFCFCFVVVVVFLYCCCLFVYLFFDTLLFPGFYSTTHVSLHGIRNLQTWHFQTCKYVSSHRQAVGLYLEIVYIHELK